MNATQVKSWAHQKAMWAHWQLESRTDFKVTKLSQVPGNPGHFTPEWLTAAMCKGAPGARVVDFERTGGTSGSNFRERILLSYNAAGREAGLPDSAFTKSSVNLAGRKLTGVTGTRRGESNFYNLVRPHLELDSPVAYHAAYHATSGRGILVMEDLPHTRQATFANIMDTKVDLALMKLMLTQVAVLHGTYWNRPLAEGRAAWLNKRTTFYELLQATFDCERASITGAERSHEVLPERLDGRGQEMWDGFVRSLAIEERTPQTMTHCDVHLGNWFLTPDHRPGLYDWGTIVSGNPGADLAYVMTSALTVEDRRAWEDELVQHYVDQLATHGVQVSTDEVWTWTRQQVFHALFNWIFTIGVKADLEGRDEHGAPDMQTDEVCLANVERMAAAVDDWDSLVAVRA